MPPLEVADEQGFGELTDYNRSLVVDGYFRLHPEQLASVVEEGLHKYAAVGVTSYVSHIMGLQFLNVFQTLVRENRMPIRFAFTHYFGFQSNEDPSAFYMRLGDMAGLGTEHFWSAGVGLGNIDSGPPMICSSMEGPPEIKEREWCRNAPGSAFAKGVLSAILARGRIATGHAYGDKGVDYLMDTVDEAMQLDPTITLDYVRSRRFSSDHCGFYPRPDQMPRMANLGWWISCGGNVLSRSYPWLEQYGMQYEKWISPVKSLISHGIRVVYENEAGVQVNNDAEAYWAQGYALVSRMNEYGVLVSPEEAIDRVTLMKMSTSWPAEYALREDELGTLETGKLADLLVLNKDYFTIPENEIPQVFPVMTLVGGKILVLRKEYADQIGMSPIGPQLNFRKTIATQVPGGRRFPERMTVDRADPPSDELMKIRPQFFLRALVFLVMLPCFQGNAHDVITTEITFHREIIRIFQARCVSCHQKGGNAFPLTTYEEIRPWAKAIQEEVLLRRMPPWEAVKGFGKFRNEQALTLGQIDLIVDWIDGGAPEGEQEEISPVANPSDTSTTDQDMNEMPVRGDTETGHVHRTGWLAATAGP